jgi:hypothetical protein
MTKLMPNKNLVVYTCITGGYDSLMPPRKIEPEVDYVCFTDQTSIISAPGWEIRPIPPELGGYALANRFAKMHPHILFPEYKLSIYVDGNIEIVGSLHALAELTLANNNIALYEHPFRNCIYLEADVCTAIGYDWYWRIRNQMSVYKRNGFPACFGLYECSVIMRRHSDNGVIELMEDWWNAYQNGIKRDQVSLPYLAWRQGVRIQNMGKSDPRFGGENFSLSHGHRQSPRLRNRVRGFINRKLHHWFP